MNRFVKFWIYLIAASLIIVSCGKDDVKKEEEVDLHLEGAPVITFTSEEPMAFYLYGEAPVISGSVVCDNDLALVVFKKVAGSQKYQISAVETFEDPSEYSFDFTLTLSDFTPIYTAVMVEATDIYGNVVSKEFAIEPTNTPPTYDPEPIGTALAFPGAEGHGAYTTGGRGGTVYIVNSLNDTNTEGTLRYALTKQGPRIIVFQVSGTIQLKSALKIAYGDVTIAGQTAPGDGICLSNYPMSINASNVIIRYIRSRMGNTYLVEDDAMNGRNQKNIIIDHCSMSWSIDEAASFYDNENFTLQWCIISESLYLSGHEKGAHGYGGIWGGWGASFHHNLLAHHTSRNPRFCGARYHYSTAEKEIVDFRNNVIYNWGFNSAYGGEAGQHNMVNNYYKAGPATSKHKDRIINPSYSSSYPTVSKWYVTGNYVYGYPAVTADNWNGGVQPDVLASMAELKAESAYATGPIVTQTAAEAYVDVLAGAGASFPKRDAIDARVVGEVENGTATYGGSYGANTGIIDTQDGVGGWAVLSSLDAPVDSDKDGMPDAWEIANGLNSNLESDCRLKPSGSDYTNLEIYLNSLVEN